MNILANVLSKDTHTDPITGEMTNKHGTIVRTDRIQSYAGP